MINPADYGSRNLVSDCMASDSEREDRGIQDSKSDEEVLIHFCEELLDAVIIPILKHYTAKDEGLTELVETLRSGGQISRKLEGLGSKLCFSDFSILEDDMLVRG